MAAAGTRLTTHFNRDGVGVVRDMRLATGPVTAFRLLEGGRRAVVITADISPAPDRSFDGVGGWCRSLRWDGQPRSATEVVAQLLDERLPHHLALVSGDHGEAMHELAVILGAAVVPAGQSRSALVAGGPRSGEGGR